MSDLSQETIRELVDYRKETGEMFWRRRPLKYFASQRSCNSWNAKFAGRQAGGIDARGYGQIGLLDGRYRTHRVAYIWMAGGSQDLPIDHINGDRFDNRWSNLRLCTKFENARNTKRPSDNKSGHIGVYRHSNDKHWIAQIRTHGKTRYLGSFDHIDDAVMARTKASADHGFHENHGREG